MFLRALNIGPRLAAGFGVLLLLLISQGIFALYEMSQMDEISTEINEDWLPGVRAVGDLGTSIMRYRVFTLRVAADDDPVMVKENIERLRAIKTDVRKNQARYEEVINTVEERAVYDRYVEAQEEYFENSDILVDYAQDGDFGSAMGIVNIALGGPADRMAEALLELSNINQEGSREADARGKAVFVEAQTAVIAAIVVAVLLVIGLAVFLARSIVQPLAQALDNAETIAAGDLSQPIDVKGNDEPARLLNSLALMRENLRSAISQISNSSTQLASATEELSSVAEDSSRSLQEQTDEIQQAASAVTEMTAAVEEVARNATETSESSSESASAAKDGLSKVLETRKSIQFMTDEIDKTSESVNGLAEQANDIGKVMDVILAIAEQTNLLALNAAIEAARAGEAGRGFAVVADEVRALAHRTQTSTKEIETIISNIQNGTKNAVSSMELSSTRATETLSVAKAASDALERIAEGIDDINERNQVIASASEEQASVAREVDRNLVKISDIATQSAAGANQTSASAEELSRLAVELNTLVSRFQL
ncbi:methyl-accepting chemotaxis protein [Marinimicrobium sp. C2-29]|uniref:methyl-accepting chemotaxis protein n=1 Tax=Marinimicrobium sp. C2-29 TaxID=3139825 RepID=UPI003139E82E